MIEVKKLDINHLEYIVEVAKSGSINKAAQNLFISQSNLSSIIKNIETEIGYVIFARNTSGTYLTQEGKLFIRHAKEILAETAKIKKVPEIFEENHNLSIVASRASFIFHCFFDFIRTFPYDSAKDTFLGAGLQENFRNIVSQRCRLGILVMFMQKQEKYTLLAERYNLEFKSLKDNIPMMVFMAKNHPLAKEKFLDISSLSEHPFIVDADIDPDDTLDILNIKDSNKVLFTCDLANVFNAVHKGQYISIGIDIAPSDASLFNFVRRPVMNAKAMSVCLIKNKDINLSVRERNFVDYLTNCLNDYYKI